jgi:uncharacterized protein (DUF1800 family)
MPITAYTGTFGKPQLMHLLRRTMFGLKKTDIAFFTGKSLDEVVTALLTAPPLTSPLNNYGTTTVPADTGSAYGQTWVNAPYVAELNGARQQSFLGWWMGAMAYQERSIHWKMVMFWYNHLPVSLFLNGIDNAHEGFKYIRHIQTYALGNFKAFIRANAVTYPMLDYLDGNLNTKTAANENYARELQELFAVGKDLDPHYTEDDVREAAKVLTGWRYTNAPALVPYFDLTRHNTANKTFSAFYNNTVITGRSDASAGDTELNDLMTMVFAHPEVARYIVRKLYRHFVYYTITPDIETNVILPLADTFRSSGYEIAPVVRALLTSQHFYEPDQMGCIIKSPLDYILGTVRTFGVATLPDTTNHYGIYRQYTDLQNACVSNRMRIYQAPNVAGWQAYYTAPNYHELWINADTLRQRKGFADVMTTGNGYYTGYKINALTFTATLTRPDDVNLLLDEVLELAHPLPVDATVRAALKNILLSNQTNESYWTQAWNNYINAPTNTGFANTARTRLQLLYQAIVNMAESNLY